MNNFYIWTSHGKVLKAQGRNALAASQVVEASGNGRVLKVMTEVAWNAYNKPNPDTCRYCGMAKVICGNWCRAGGMP